MWLMKSGERLSQYPEDNDINIPFEELQIELEKQYPGRWPGSFCEGARGPRFWEPDADNPTAAIVRRVGMQCFTGDYGFRGWSQIFGTKFVRKFEAFRTGNASKRTAYDGQCYWYQNTQGVWETQTGENYKRILTASYGVKATGKKGITDVDKFLVNILYQRRVEAAGPFVHYPYGPMRYNGSRFLNTAIYKVLQPRKEPCEHWGDGFPWVAKFFDTFFDEPGTKQRDVCLAWLTTCYVAALAQKPRSGQAEFLGGPTNIGKTFYTRRIVSPILGGHADASAYLLGDDTFTESYFCKPILALDDAEVAADRRIHKRYTERLKKLVANPDFMSNQKYRKASMIHWQGRVIVTCNDDAISLDILPSLDLSNQDKLILLKCKKPDVSFDDAEGIVASELPAFCRWMLSWEIPEELLGSPRFGIKEYLHPILVAAANERSPASQFLSVLRKHMQYFADNKTMNQGSDTWVGGAVQLTIDLGTGPLATVVKNMEPYRISQFLDTLMALGYNLRCTDSNEGKIWSIPVDIKREVRS
jgi:hypothetical protein